MKCPTWTLVVVLPIVTAGSTAHGEEPVDEKARTEAFQAFAQKEADAYTFRLDAPGAVVLKREPEPVLRWSNPLLGSLHGSLYLWTDRGRPAVAASIHKWHHPFTQRANEFQSLVTTHLIGERDGETVWEPDRPGVEFRSFEDAGEPSANRGLRLRQMRDLASNFSASERERPTAAKPNSTPTNLRLLTQPVYRYPAAQDEIMDGALFAFVAGTDPEAFLVIEARKRAGKYEWQYAPVRMTSMQALRFTYRDREVWTSDYIRWAQVIDRREPHTTFQFRSEEGAKAP